VIELEDGFHPIAIFFKHHVLSWHTDSVDVKPTGKSAYEVTVSNELFLEMMYPSDYWQGAECIFDA
jgi:hypothetical protein